MKERLSEELGRLCTQCYLISTTTAHDVFLEYSPHVETISIYVCEGGWAREAGSVWLTKIGGDRITLKGLNAIKRRLQKYKKAPAGAATPDAGTDLKNQLQSTPNLGDCQGGN